MLEQIGKAIQFDVFFTASKQGKTGLTVTVDVYRDATQIVTAASATEVGGGLYTYSLASGSSTVAANYRAIFHTTDSTVDFKDIPALWIVGRNWVQNVDAATSSRAAPGDILATTANKLATDSTGKVGANNVPTVSQISAGILSTPANLLLTNSSGQVQHDLTQAVPTSNTAQTVGDSLNAARAQGFGKWTLSGTTLTLFAADGSTTVRTFTLDSATSPTQRA